MAKKLGITESDAQAVLQQRLAEQSEEKEPSVTTVNGWTKVCIEDLPTGNHFYQEVWVKPFDVKIVRELSSVDPNDMRATLKGMCSILSKYCYIIDLKGNKTDGSHLKRADALPVLLVIRALTYDDDFSLNLVRPYTCDKCGKEITSIKCDGALNLPWPEKFDEIATIDADGNIIYNKLPSLAFRLPSIEEVSMFINILASDDPKMRLDDVTKSDASALLYIIPPVLSSAAMYHELVQSSSKMYGMNLKEIAVFRKFVSFLDKNIGTESFIDTTCPNCGDELKIPFSVGISDIVLANVEDL